MTVKENFPTSYYIVFCRNLNPMEKTLPGWNVWSPIEMNLSDNEGAVIELLLDMIDDDTLEEEYKVMFYEGHTAFDLTKECYKKLARRWIDQPENMPGFLYPYAPDSVKDYFNAEAEGDAKYEAYAERLRESEV